jgi:diaminopimelate decarboxylase
MDSALQRLLPDSATVERGTLHIAGCEISDLAARYGTPLYIYDEMTLRQQARRVLRAFAPAGRVSFAAKACSTPGVIRVLGDERLGLDVVSEGEMLAGERAGVPASRMHLHGNCKTDAELRRAVLAGVHAIVLDNREEIERLDAICRDTQRQVRVILRLDPPVSVRTHPSLDTSGFHSKFGFLMDSVEQEEALKRIEGSRLLRLVGLHIHLGSQVADPEVYGAAAAELLRLARTLADRGFALEELSLGGGWATPYRPGDPELLPEQVAAVLPEQDGIRWAVEPGRALAARAGVAVYRVGAVKWRDGQRLVVVDGGMGDNPRPALYGAGYTALAAEKMEAPRLEPAQVVGRYCESGDILVREAALPDVRAGDLLVVPVSGAYHLSMASAYNLVPPPAAVLVSDSGLAPLTRRATAEELLSREEPPVPDRHTIDTPTVRETR